MPLQNRVLPTGEIVADPARGLFMGNRGILHDEAGRLGKARWRHPHWITCLTAFKGRRRVPMAPHAYTELFFLDEAVALAAGHRPCAECRRAAFAAYRAAVGLSGAAAIDRALHAARIGPDRGQRRETAQAAALPDGAFVLIDGRPHLLRGPAALPFSPAGYGPARPRPAGPVAVLTPAPSLLALARGYVPLLHPSAQLSAAS